MKGVKLIYNRLGFRVPAVCNWHQHKQIIRLEEIIVECNVTLKNDLLLNQFLLTKQLVYDLRLLNWWSRVCRVMDWWQGQWWRRDRSWSQLILMDGAVGFKSVSDVGWRYDSRLLNCWRLRLNKIDGNSGCGPGRRWDWWRERSWVLLLVDKPWCRGVPVFASVLNDGWTDIMVAWLAWPWPAAVSGREQDCQFQVCPIIEVEEASVRELRIKYVVQKNESWEKRKGW